MKPSISMKTSLILLFPALAAAGLLWAFSFFLQQIETVSAFTDIAGRQRMFSVQLHEYTYTVGVIGRQEDRKKFKRLIGRFNTSLNLLLRGGPLPDMGVNLPPPPSEVKSALTTAVRLWTPLQTELLLIADLPQAAPRARRAWEVAKVNLPKLTLAADAVVKDFVAYNIRQDRNMNRLLMINIVFTLLVFIGGIWIARRYIVRPVRQLVDVSIAMADGDYSQRLDMQGYDELTALMVAFNTMADAITAAITRERGLRQQQEVIFETISRLSSELTNEAILRYVGELAMQTTGARYAVLAHLEEGERQFIPLGLDAAALANFKDHPPQGMGLLGLPWSQRQLVQVNNITEHPQSCGFPEGHPPMSTMLGAPIEFSDNMIGALYLCDRKDGRPFDTDDEKLVRMLASSCAVALSNSQRFTRLQEAKVELEQRVSERTHELSDANRMLRNREVELELMNDELHAANEAKTQFLSNTSHELRTPLNAIIGFSDLLLTAHIKKLSSKQKEYVEYINIGGKQLLELINNLLDLSKIEAGVLDINEEPSAPGIALDFMVNQLKPLAQKKRLKIRIFKPEVECAVYIDTGKLQQVWVNLLGNAIKFTPEGGHIELGYQISHDAGGDDMLEGYVQDSGIGLNTTDIERIFLPFMQVEGGITREYGGTGLGLALVYHLLEMQGGAIQVQSTPGTGSRFSFVLPTRLVAENSAETEHVLAETEHEGATTRLAAAVELVEETAMETVEHPVILVVDDDKARAAAVAVMLGEEGYRGEISNLVYVEQLAEETCPLLILVGMPSDSADIYRRLHLLRSRKATRNIPLVLLGGDAEEPNFSLGTIDTMDQRMTRNDLVDLISRHGRHAMNAAVMTVLVVDDDAGVREYIKESLYGQGYRILLAANGRDGIQAAIDHDPDLIILDLMMPGMSGFEVVEKLKHHPTACDIPVVIFTAKDLTREEVMQLGQEVEKVLTKGSTGRADLLRELRSLELLYPVRARLMDSTLQCYNARYMQLRLVQECSRATRYGQQFSLVGWKMDGFDDYVCQHGQRWSMAALKDCVELVHMTIRKGDVLVRSSEATFTLILPSITPSAVERVAEKIRLRIHLHGFPLAGNEVGHFTASFGCAHFGEDEDSPESMIEKLQLRVARAKKAGGNCLVADDGGGNTVSTVARKPKHEQNTGCG